MIFNIVQTGRRKVLCSFLGAIGEKLTFSQNGVVIKKDVPQGTEIELKQGVYDVTGSESGYTKKIKVKDSGEYCAYPDGALYWYGREIVPFSVARQDGASGSVTKNTNNIHIKYNGNSYKRAVGVLTKDKVDLSGYKKLRAIISNDNNGNFSVTNTRSLSYDSCSDGSIFAKRKWHGSHQEQTFTLDVSILDSGYVGEIIYEYNKNQRNSYVYAIWLDEPKGYTETLCGTNTTALSSTLRYTTYDSKKGWASPSRFGHSENYFGYKTGDCNVALVPLGKFSFDGHSTRLRIKFNGHRPNDEFDNFSWAICTSDSNRNLYCGQTGGVVDNTQISSGTATLANYRSYANSNFTFDFATENIPSDTNLYLYLWPYERSGVAHISSDITATLYYGAY